MNIQAAKSEETAHAKGKTNYRMVEGGSKI